MKPSQTNNIGFFGRQGSGKTNTLSYIMHVFQYLHYPIFLFNITMPGLPTIKSFMELIKIRDNIKTGIIAIDEIDVLLGARDWDTEKNKEGADFFTKLRHSNKRVYYTVQTQRQVDPLIKDQTDGFLLFRISRKQQQQAKDVLSWHYPDQTAYIDRLIRQALTFPLGKFFYSLNLNDFPFLDGYCYFPLVRYGHTKVHRATINQTNIEALTPKVLNILEGKRITIASITNAITRLGYPPDELLIKRINANIGEWYNARNRTTHERPYRKFEVA